MKKVLLSLAAFSFLTAGHAQLLTYGFEESETLPGIIVGENWTNYPNCTYNWESTDAPHTGARALAVHVDPVDCGDDGTTECGTWERVVAITNTGFQPLKSYRVSLWSKGAGRINVALLKGCFYHDKAGYDQTSTVSVSGEYTKQVFNFWVPSRDWFTGQNNDFADDEYWNQDFLRLSFLAAGDYNIDDITIEESAVKAVSFNANTVCVEYAYSNNITTLAGTDVAEIEGVAATVNVNGTDIEVRNIEAHSDGKLYLFLGEKELKKADVVKVSISNAGPVAFNLGGSYEFTADACPSITFEGEVANHDQNLIVTAFADAEPKLLTTYPSDGSFEIDPATKEFTFTFDHVIEVMDAEYAPKAYLDQEELVVKSTANAKTIVFERTSTADLVKGTYTLKIQGVATDAEYGLGQWSEATVGTASFEVGDVNVATVEYTDLSTIWMEGEYNTAQPTNGWISYFNGAENTTNANRVGNMVTPDMGVGFYFCQRDGEVAAQLTYGEKEDALLALPTADNLQLCLYHTMWQGAGGTIKYSLIKKAEALTDTIATGTATATDNTGGFGETVTGVTPVSVKLPAITEGNYVLALETSAGWSGTIVYGFKIQSYSISEGDVATSEVVFQETFASFEGKMPQEGSGFFCYNANNRLEPGSTRSGTSGILTLGTGGMVAAFFARECGDNTDGAHRITYGEEESGKELVFGAGAWDITYKSATWNDNNGNANGTSKTYMELRDFNTGEVVYKNIHVNSNAANYMNGVNNNPNVQADKVKSTFNTAGGKYILWIYGSQNTVVGDILIEKPGSKAVKYHTQLNNYIADAKAELETSADVKYDGTTKSALIAAVEKYSKVPNGMHTPAEYDAACEELENLTKALATRRTTIVKYDQAIIDINAYLFGETAIAEKYQALDCYKTLTETYATYKDITAQSLEDAELISATSTLENAYNTTKHMVEVGVPALTAQINELIAQLVALDEAQAETELVIAAGNSITDDQVFANQLKLQVLQKLYTKIATDENFFIDIDEEGIQSDKPFDVTTFIQNPKVYTNAPAHDNCKIANYPGWESDKPDFGMRPNYGWGGWDNSAYYLIHASNMFIGIGWVGNDGVTVSNNVQYLPVGTYDLTIATMDRSGVGEDSEGNKNVVTDETKQQSYIFIQQGENEAVTKGFDVSNIGDYYGFTDDLMSDVDLTGEVYADAKVGAYIHAEGSFAAIRDVRLSLKAKAANFDYAAAATALAAVIADGIQVVREDAPIAARYFNLNGLEINEAEGVCIKVETYSDGYTVIKKIVK